MRLGKLLILLGISASTVRCGGSYDTEDTGSYSSEDDEYESSDHDGSGDYGTCEYEVEGDGYEDDDWDDPYHCGMYRVYAETPSDAEASYMALNGEVAYDGDLWEDWDENLEYETNTSNLDYAVELCSYDAIRFSIAYCDAYQCYEELYLPDTAGNGGPDVDGYIVISWEGHFDWSFLSNGMNGWEIGSWMH